MRTRLEGTQVSGAGESHAQEANVAEVSYGEAVNGKAENPEIIKPPGGSRERIGVTPSKPTVSLGVTSAVVNTYGCDNGRISPTHCAVIAAALDGR